MTVSLPPVGSTITILAPTCTHHNFVVGTTAVVTEHLSNDGYGSEVIEARGMVAGYGRTPAREDTQVLAADEFTFTETLVFAVGARVRVVARNANGARVAIGDEGIITDANSDGEWYVKMDAVRGSGALYRDHHDADWTLRAEQDIEVIATPVVEVTETLDAFRLRFLTAAVERGRLNGGKHPAQVTLALDNLARVEFLSPSLTLADFQQRVVDLAMAAKAQHMWCGEPEEMLTDLGLGHLIPRRVTVTVTARVFVTVPAGASEADIRNIASDSVTLGGDADYITNRVIVS